MGGAGRLGGRGRFRLWGALVVFPLQPLTISMGPPNRPTAGFSERAALLKPIGRGSFVQEDDSDQPRTRSWSSKPESQASRHAEIQCSTLQRSAPAPKHNVLAFSRARRNRKEKDPKPANPKPNPQTPNPSTPKVPGPPVLPPDLQRSYQRPAETGEDQPRHQVGLNPEPATPQRPKS